MPKTRYEALEEIAKFLRTSAATGDTAKVAKGMVKKLPKRTNITYSLWRLDDFSGKNPKLDDMLVNFDNKYAVDKTLIVTGLSEDAEESTTCQLQKILSSPEYEGIIDSVIILPEKCELFKLKEIDNEALQRKMAEH